MHRPIGIFDSGVGGLSIARRIRQLLPAERLLYVADQKFAPYGVQSKQLIGRRSESIAGFLQARDCKAVVVACNTATVNSIERLRQRFRIPIVGVEPGIKPAALSSKSGVVGVLATEQTLRSESFQRLAQQFSSQARIVTRACPRFVELVEAASLDGTDAEQAVAEYLQPLLDCGADQIVLGCTHFSFLSPLIEKAVAGRAGLVDTAMPVAFQLQRRLNRLQLLNRAADTDGEEQAVSFFSSQSSPGVAARMTRLWGQSVNLSAMPVSAQARIDANAGRV